MTEKEMIQAILRNCKPRLASLFRVNLQLVRVGTQVERDISESNMYWNMMNADEQRKKGMSQESQRKKHPSHTRVVQNVKGNVQHNSGNLTIPLNIQGKLIAALIDTGSTFFNAKIHLETVV